MAKLRQDVQSTNPLIWFAAIVCAILAFAVIIVGLIAFIGYMITRPKIPSITVTYAHLDVLDYDQYGELTTQITLTMTAQNHNAKARASFSNLHFLVQFNGINVAELRSDPFDVPKNSSRDLVYNIPSSPIPLNMVSMDEINSELQRNVISFDIMGSAGTRWKLGTIGSVKYWIHLSCRVQFNTPPNGSSINTDCHTKSH